jgi:hypothetical protein
VHRRSSDRVSGWQSVLQRWGPRRARQALVLATLLYLLVVIGIAVLLLTHGLPWERKLRAGIISVLALVALWLWLRVLRRQWAQLRVVSGGAKPDSEDTGIWGVGGPGMRTPGTTGLTHILRDRRRAPEGEDGDNPP